MSPHERAFATALGQLDRDDFAAVVSGVLALYLLAPPATQLAVSLATLAWSRADGTVAESRATASDVCRLLATAVRGMEAEDN